MKIHRHIFTLLAALAIALTPTVSEAIIHHAQEVDWLAKSVANDRIKNAPQDTLFLFNIPEVLTDSTITLGSQSSRKYIKEMTKKMKNPPKCDARDALNWLIFNKIPHKIPEREMSNLIQYLQDNGVAVAGLTSRGRTKWYSTEMPGVDTATEQMLNSLGIDLAKSPLPIDWTQVKGNKYATHYHNGIYYCNHMDKGAFLKNLFSSTGHQPKYIIAFDYNLETLKSMERTLADRSLKFLGIHYTRTAADHANFDPMVCVLQLKQLVEEGTILSDDDAAQLATSWWFYFVDPDALCVEILDSMDFSNFPPK